MLTTKYLFEIPIYRLNEYVYQNDMNAHIEKLNSKFENPMDIAYLRDKYGGVWRYNEIIGFLRFFQYGENRIRCEYWDTDSVNKVRTKRKLFVQKSNNYCNEPFSKSSMNSDLAETMKKAVEHCEGRIKNKKRFLDRELFDNTVDHIDWSGLIN